MGNGTRRRWLGRRTPDAPPTAGAATAIVTEPTALDAAGAPADPPDPPAPLAGEDLDAVYARLTDYVYVQVRSGVFDREQLRELALQAAESEITNPAQADEVAREVLFREIQEWRADATRWGARTDCDRLDQAMDRIATLGILALPGLIDEQTQAESIRVRGAEKGCVSYLVPDIWRAIDGKVLLLRVLDGAGRPAGRRSDLTRRVIDALSLCGLLSSAGPADGQVSVALIWRRRPAG